MSDLLVTRLKKAVMKRILLALLVWCVSWQALWAANAIKYVDNVNGNNGNTGDSEAQAYADIDTALATFTGGGNIVYVQNTGTSYAPFNCGATAVGDTTNGPNIVEGYTTTPGARDGRPTVTSSTNSAALITCSVDYWRFVHLNLTHTASTRGPVLSGGAADLMYFYDITASGCSQWLGTANSNNNLYFEQCTIDGFTSSSPLIAGSATSNGNTISMYGCVVKNNAGPLTTKATTSGAGTLTLQNSVFYNNTGTYLVSYTSSGAAPHRITAVNCSFANNSGGVLEISNTSSSTTLNLINNIFWSNGGIAVVTGPGSNGYRLLQQSNRNNAYGSNTGGNFTNFSAGVGDVSLSGNPFTNAGSGDFSLDNTPDEGADCRAAGFPGVFAGGLTTSYSDIGAVQHQDTGGGGGNTYSRGRVVNK